MSWGRMGNGWGEVRVNGRVVGQRGRVNEVLRVQHSKSTGSSVDKYVTE